jgi:hypothetical protein
VAGGFPGKGFRARHSHAGTYALQRVQDMPIWMEQVILGTLIATTTSGTMAAHAFIYLERNRLHAAGIFSFHVGLF